jgi:hypothetical protein
MSPEPRFGRPELGLIGSRSGTTQALGHHAGERIAPRGGDPQAGA